MKTKDFTPIKIGFNDQGKNQFNTDLIKLRSLVNDFFEEAGKYIEIKDKNKFKGDLFKVFINEFSDKYKTQFPDVLTLDKIMELVSVNVDKLRFLSSKVNEFNIDFDYNTNEIETPDFSIYTSNNEENLLFKYAQGISEAIYNNRPQGITLFNADLQRGFVGILIFDFSSQKLVPNVGYIKGQFKRI